MPAELQRVALLAVGPAKRLALEAQRALVEPRRRLDVGDGEDDMVDAVGQQRHVGSFKASRRPAQAPARRARAG